MRTSVFVFGLGLFLLVARSFVSPQSQEPLRSTTGQNEPAFTSTEKLQAIIPKDYTWKGPGVSWWAAFSKDGTKVAYVARHRVKDRIKECIIVGDNKGPDFLWVMEPVFSADGSKLVYLGVDDSKGGQPLFIVSGDSKMQIQFKDKDTNPTWIPVFSRDSTKLAYKVEIEGNGKHGIVLTDTGLTGKPDVEFDDVSEPVISPDGSMVAYVAVDGNSYSVIFGDKKGKPFDKTGSPRISPNGHTVAYNARKDGKAFVVVGEEKGPEFDRVWEPTFSPDGTEVAYPAQAAGKNFVMVGKKQLETKVFFDEIVFSQDGSKTAYWAYGKERQSLIVGDHEGPKFDWVSAPVFSRDLSTAAYIARVRDKYLVMVGDTPGPKFDQVGEPVFSPDGHRVGYGALKGKEIWWKVVDAR